MSQYKKGDKGSREWASFLVSEAGKLANDSHPNLNGLSNSSKLSEINRYIKELKQFQPRLKWHKDRLVNFQHLFIKNHPSSLRQEGLGFNRRKPDPTPRRGGGIPCTDLSLDQILGGV